MAKMGIRANRIFDKAGNIPQLVTEIAATLNLGLIIPTINCRCTVSNYADS